MQEHEFGILRRADDGSSVHVTEARSVMDMDSALRSLLSNQPSPA
ncbi:MAG: hypothetical protein ACLSHC_14520 [Bilophila wadsworthia]